MKPTIKKAEAKTHCDRYLAEQWSYSRNMMVDIEVLKSDQASAVARLELKSSLESKQYAYQIRVLIDQTSRQIVDAGLDCLTAEAPACEQAGNLMMKMIGLHLDEKYLWRISNIFGRKEGCRHLYELSLEIGRAYANMKLGEYMKTANTTAQSAVTDLIDMKNHCAGLSALWQSGELQ